VRIAEHRSLQQRGVRCDLRLGIEAGACVIQVDVIVRVQPPVLRRAQVIEPRGFVMGDCGLRLEFTGHTSIIARRRVRSYEADGDFAGRCLCCVR
jgi:hypothetical protein